MKTKWHIYILWSVLSLGLLSSAVHTYESKFTRRKKLFKLGTPKSKPSTLSSTGDRQSTQRLPGSTSSLSSLSSRRSYPPSVRETPRSGRPQEPRAMIQSDFAYLPDVSVTCSTSDFVVRVKPAFYGLGADAEELKLGNTCKSNGVLRPYDDLLFTYPLTACDAVRQSPRGYLVYKFVLHYVPSPKRFPSRAHRIDVNIECRYPRNHYVYQLTVQPTWKTAVVRKRLKGSPNDFRIELMDESWSRPARSQVYQLGKTVNFQVSAPHLPAGGKLYINSCYATPSSGSKSSLKYIIIDNFGCMLDSKRDPGASQFVSRTDGTVRFSLKAFQFISDPETEVNVHCKLFVTSEDLGPAHKSCTFKGNRWKALTGDDSICACCDSQCASSKPRRAMMEGSASSGSVLVSDQPYATEVGFLPISPSSVSMSREDKASIGQYTDVLHSHENFWGSVDIVKHGDDNDVEDKEALEEDEKESGVIQRVMTEPDLEELGFGERDLMEEKKESEVRDLNQFEEDGSGYFVQEDFSGSETGLEGREDEMYDVQQVIHFDQKEDKMLPSEASLHRLLQPLVLEGEDKNWKHVGRGEEDERMIASEVEWKGEDKDLINNREMTWYFPWR